MNTIELINEKPSPNVTFNVPNAFRALYGMGAEAYSCTVHDSIYIFDPLYDNTRELVKRAFDMGFESYREHMYPVDVTGFKNPEGRIGSTRFCTMSSHLANFFTVVINDSQMLDMLPGQFGVEEFVQVSKYFRAMRYESGGEHFPHYDSDFTLVSTKNVFVTKMSLVAYGNDCETGEIAFVNDKKDALLQDWSRQAEESEIYLKIKPKVGRIVVFDHSLCHTVLPYTDAEGERRILRGDLIFNMV